MTKTTIEEGAVTLEFPSEYGVMKYDESDFLKKSSRKYDLLRQSMSFMLRQIQFG